MLKMFLKKFVMGNWRYADLQHVLLPQQVLQMTVINDQSTASHCELRLTAPTHFAAANAAASQRTSDDGTNAQDAT